MIELIELTVFASCLLVSGLFSSIETALGSMSKMRIEKLFNEEEPTYQRLQIWQENPNRYLTTLLFAKTFLQIIAAVVAVDLTVRWLDQSAFIANTPLIALSIAALATTLILWLFSETLPKAIGKENALAISIASVGPINVLNKLANPLIQVVLFTANLFMRPFTRSKIDALPLYMEDDVQSLIDMGEKEGVFEEEEREMIHSIIDFGETQVKEIMTPRIDLQTIPIDLDPETARQEAISLGRSRIPVYEEDLDHIAGILYAKDLLKLYNGHQANFQLSDLLRTPLFVSKDKYVSELLDTFKKEKTHMAIVVDEYGLTAGVVTIEDVLEEIVGDIQDEFDQEASEYELHEDGSIIADAKIDLDILAEVMDFRFPEHDVETLGGFLSTLLGRVPKVDEEIDYQSLRFLILDADERRVKRVKIKNTAPQPQQEEISIG